MGTGKMIIPYLVGTYMDARQPAESECTTEVPSAEYVVLV